MSQPRHLVWDWNGTLLDDLTLVIDATNVALSTMGGPVVTADEHRRDFRRPIIEYYSQVLGRPLDVTEFAALDKIFQDAYQAGLPCELSTDARDALAAWSGTQSLLSMWFHTELVPAVQGHGLTPYFQRIDGLPALREHGGDHKAPYLQRHLAAQGLDGTEVVLIGDSVDDAHAAVAVGARCVLYSGGFTHPDQLRATGMPVAESLAEAVERARALP